MNKLPYNQEAEMSLIGALLSFPEGRDICMSKLLPVHFHDPRHKTIFEIVSRMASDSLPVDAQTVFNAYKGPDIGMEVYLFQLATGFPTISHVEFYIKELKNKYRLRKLLQLMGEVQKDALTESDNDGYFEKIERQFFDLTEERQEEDLLKQTHIKVLEIMQNIKQGHGVGAIPTGVHAIDSLLQGVSPGMMDVYAAEAGCGKTSLVEMIAKKFLLEDRPILIFQRDMTPAGFLFRLACRMADVNVSALRRWGFRMPNELEQVEKWAKVISKSHLKLYSPDGCTGADVRMIARREKRRHSIQLVIVDHMRTLKHSKNTSWDGLEENSGYIRQSTNETGVPHIVLTHINREGANSSRPSISNIKGGDQLKDDSDNCCVMWAPEGRPAKETGIKQWKVNFAFDKTRWDFNSVETMMFNGPMMRFEKIEKEQTK